MLRLANGFGTRRSHRYGIPRSDLQVTLDGVRIKPALALGGWLGFANASGQG